MKIHRPWKKRPERPRGKQAAAAGFGFPPNARWNGERCHAFPGTVLVGECRPGWWCEELEGTRRKCVMVFYQGEYFFLDDEDGSGSHKVFETGGGPFCAGHKSLPVDDMKSFVLVGGEDESEPAAEGLPS